ncbi:MAG: NADH-quinone oxidoreductase subunit C [Acidimicrobiales bacterium]
MSSLAELSERRAAAVERLGAELGEALVATHEAPGRDTWVRVRTDAWRTAGEVLRHRLGFEYFDFLSAIDWLPSPYGRGEDDPTQPAPERSTEIRPGYTGGETRLQVLARVFDVRNNVGLLLKVDVPDAEPAVASWVPVYAGANWHERETWEMFGIVFAGHPDLRKLYLPTGFEGFPLRKDYPLLARLVKPWPGIVDVEPMPEGMAGEE